MNPEEFKIWWRRFRALTSMLRDQGITNVRQLYQWASSVDVSSQIIAYLRSHPGLQGIIYWVGGICVGLFAVFYARLFEQVFLIPHWVLEHKPWVLFATSPACFVLAWWLVHRFAPGAAGGGIPELMVAIEVDSSKASIWAGWRAGVVKFLSSISTVLGGGAIGREGPTIQIAAAIFYTLGMPLRRIWPSISHQSLLVAGGSAGIAAAFNTPLGGIVFAVEELSQQHFNRFKTFLISSVIVAGLVAQWILGPYLYLGYPKLAVISFTALPWALAVGLIAGLAGALFGRGIAWVANRTSGLRPSRRIKVAILVGLLTAVGGWWAGSEAIGSGSDLVTRVLFDENNSVSWWVVLGRCVEPVIAGAAGGATGIFGPSLSAGAAIGAKFAELTQTPYPNLSVLLGMAAFLSGVTRAPFTAFVLVLEMTDRHSAIFPLMMASLVASLVGKLVDGKSCYERRCETLLKQYESLPAPLPTKE
jgi:H+/Cl- antiporter ClcA